MKNRQRILKGLLLGILGAVLWAASEWLVAALGAGNDRNGLIESNWAKLPMWRFRLSVILCSISVPLIGSGVKAFNSAIRYAIRKRYLLDYYVESITEFSMNMLAGSMLFLMTVKTVIPVIYKSLFATSLMGSEIVATVESVFYHVSIPFYVFNTIVVAGISLGYLYFGIIGRLRMNPLAAFLNPLTFVILRFTLGSIGSGYINDFLSIAEALGMIFVFFNTLIFATRVPDKKANARRRRR